MHTVRGSQPGVLHHAVHQMEGCRTTVVQRRHQRRSRQVPC